MIRRARARASPRLSETRTKSARSGKKQKLQLQASWANAENKSTGRRSTYRTAFSFKISHLPHFSTLGFQYGFD